MTSHHALTKRPVQPTAQSRARFSSLFSSIGRKLVGGLLLFRMADCAIGCKPDPGEDGGTCIQPDGCRQDPYCNDGLECRNDVCGHYAPIPYYPDAGTAVGVPSGTKVVKVSPPPRSDCFREDNPRCGAPAEGWTCRYGHPEDAGDCFNALIDPSEPGEGFCCAPPTSCYTLEQTDAGKEVSCEPGEAAVLCSHAALPPDTGCRHATLWQSTYGTRAFCCQDPIDAGAD